MKNVKKKSIKKKDYYSVGNYKIKTSKVYLGLFMVILMLFSLFFSLKIEKVLGLYPDFDAINQGDLQVHFVDVGQGDAVLIKFPNNQTMIIDSGKSTYKNNLFEYIDNVFFNNNTHKKFDYVLLTHSDEDHSGNMLEVFKKYEVDVFYRPYILSSNEEKLDEYPNIISSSNKGYASLIAYTKTLSENNDLSIYYIDENTYMNNELDEYIDILSPITHNYNNTNDYSPIMIVSYLNKKVMLTGDASSDIESQVVANYYSSFDDYLDVDVLKLGHHGSKTSTSKAFLEAVKPEYAIISVGKNNSYGQPSNDVLSNVYEYAQENNTVLNNNIIMTSEKGNIIYYVKNNSSDNFFYIQSIGDYLFVSWDTIVMYGVLVCTLYTISVSVRKVNKKATRN